MRTTIIGAGLAGLLAAQVFDDADILEAMPEPREQHKALLRFRSDKVARLTRIDFRPVTVRKGIWSNNRFVEPSIRNANLYSQKVLGRLIGERSIWKLDPVERWIAPEDFYQQLLDKTEGRIKWGRPVQKNFLTNRGSYHNVISTMPIDKTVQILELSELDLQFRRAPIIVERFRVPNCDMYQTIYYPDENTHVYRASITGDLLIIEFAAAHPFAEHDWLDEVGQSFGLYRPLKLEPLGSSSQSYGKIAPVDDTKRKLLIGYLSEAHDIFSLGRFATWRNILLDDVVDDLAVVKRLITSSKYERKLHHNK